MMNRVAMSIFSLCMILVLLSRLRWRLPRSLNPKRVHSLSHFFFFLKKKVHVLYWEI